MDKLPHRNVIVPWGGAGAAQSDSLLTNGKQTTADPKIRRRGTDLESSVPSVHRIPFGSMDGMMDMP